MTASREFCDHVSDLLAGFGPFAIRRMFGGAGLFRDGAMFALIAYDTLYMKVDDTTRPAYEAQGMGPFTYEGKTEPVSLGYFQAPEAAMDDPDLLRDLAREAFGVALRAQAAKGKGKAHPKKPSAKKPKKKAAPGTKPARRSHR